MTDSGKRTERSSTTLRIGSSLIPEGHGARRPPFRPPRRQSIPTMTALSGPTTGAKGNNLQPASFGYATKCGYLRVPETSLYAQANLLEFGDCSVSGVDDDRVVVIEVGAKALSLATRQCDHSALDADQARAISGGGLWRASSESVKGGTVANAAR